MGTQRVSNRVRLASLLAAGSCLLSMSGPPAVRGAAVLPAAAQPSYPTGISLNEFMPDPVSDWNGDGVLGDANDEYIELYNANAFDVDIGGWKLDDVAGGGSSPYTLPPGTVLPGQGYLALFSVQTGIALNNSGGDSVRLLTPDGGEVESHSYTATAGDQAYSKTFDGGTEWTRSYPPSPGASNQPPPSPSPTSTPTETSTPTTSPTPLPTFTPTPGPTPSSTFTPTQQPTPTPYPLGVSLNEFMPNPETVDWNGDGILGDNNDEYVELHNVNDFAVDLSGWQVDDIANGGSSPYTLPAGTILEAQGFLALWSRDTRIGLNNSGGDAVRLLTPDGVEMESHSYSQAPADVSYSKTTNGGNQWVMTYPPSPGASNQPAPTPTATATPSPTATATPTATPSPMPTATPGTRPTFTATPSPTATATPALPPTPYPAGISLNEFMPNPEADWNGDGITGDANDEYIELFNAGDFAVDLSGWRVDDVAGGGSSPYSLPAGTVVEAQGFLVLWSRDTRIVLNNSGGDAVRLLTPDGVEVESHSYTAAPADVSYSKSVDGGDQWLMNYPPSPGASNQPGPTPTPTASPTPAGGFISGHVFLDPNQNGIFEPWLGETGLAEVLVMLSNGRSRLSSADGWYGFANLPPGQYTVRPAQPLHTSSTTPDEMTLTLAAGAVRDDVHFGKLLLPAGQVQSPVLLNEFLPSPASDWDGNGVANADDEWIELFNASDAAVDLSGWWLDDMDDGLRAAPDGSPPYLLPPGASIAPHSFLLVYRSTSGVALNNSGDSVRLLGPGRYLVESVDFGAAGADVAWSKTADGGSEWTMAYPPSPGASNQAATLTPTPTTTPTATPGVYPDNVRLNEYMPDPASDWNGDGAADQDDEYIELFNANDFEVDLSGWRLDDVDDGFRYGPFGDAYSTHGAVPDGSPPFDLPPGTTVPARGFLLFFRSQTGIALNNDGDWVRLLRPDGVVVEATEYTASRDDRAISKALDGGDQWTTTYPPSPGATNQPPATPIPTATPAETPTPVETSTPSTTATPTASPTPSRTATPTASPTPSTTETPTQGPTATPFPGGISLNEFMANPEQVDWNGDGILGDANDEYVELFNANGFSVDLSGWQVDDGEGGSAPYTLPAGTILEAGSFLALWSRDTRIALNNSGGDAVRLLRPDGLLVESRSYTTAPMDTSASKAVDGGSEWTMAYPPSPGASNQAATPTPTPTATPTATPGVYAGGVSLNEYMPDPASDWNGDGVADQNDEYVELHNANDFEVDLGGWRLDDVDDGFRYGLFGDAYSTDGAMPDGSPPYALPLGTTIPARGFLVFFRSQTGIALNNDGDWVRLLRPDGVVVEATEYSTSRDDQAHSKTLDGGSEWTRSYPPTPGGSNHPKGTPTPTPSPTPQLTPTPVATTVRLNEVLPSPQDVDWDGNGVPSYLDEWVELMNLGEEVVDLGGWRLADGLPAGHEPERAYILPDGATLPARGYLVIYRAQSGLALDASSEWVRLLYPDGSEADSMSYDRFSGYDQSWCRLPDGVGPWSRFCIESPGQPNQASPYPGGGSSGSSGGSGSNSRGSGSGRAPGSSGTPYDRFNYDLLPIAQARSLPDRTRLTLEGQVTVLPNVFAGNEIYIQDATGGMRVYLRSAEWPPLSEGQWVRVDGWLGTFYEERQISLVRIDDIKTLQPAAPPLPLPIGTGEVNEANEGRLVQISGPVTGYWKETTLYLDDGSGEARITIKASTGIRRPYVNIGEIWTVVGVTSQSESGYRLLPRREADLQRGRAAAGRANGTTHSNGVQDDMAWNRAPVFLPVTGETLLVRPLAPGNLWEAWHQAVWRWSTQ